MVNIFQRWIKKRHKRQTIEDREVDLAPDGGVANISLYDTNYVRCRFKHTTDSPFFLGNCHFEDCHFEIRKTAHSSFAGLATFENCTLYFVKASRLMFNNGQKFRNCVFKGKLHDSVFCLDPHGGDSNSGIVTGCDFRELNFDLLDFRGNGELGDTRFAAWPVASFKKARGASDQYDRDQLPLNIRRFIHVGRRPGVLVIDLSQLLNDPEELWAVAYDAPFLDFNGKSDKLLPRAEVSDRLKEINRCINRIDKKYQSIFARLCGRRYYISRAVRSENDLVLSIIDKEEIKSRNSGEFDIRLKDCTVAEFREGPFDGTLPLFEKPFYLNGYEIDHESDAVEIKGSRKAMGRLRLSFRAAVGCPE